MSDATDSRLTRRTNYSRKTIVSVVVFLLITIIGLTYVKWWPYYHKAIAAALNGTIGSSILSGISADGHAAPSWQAAIDYAVTYFRSVWKAAVLGILLGSLVQVLIPARWLYKLLGKANFRSTLIGGAISLPGMMCSCCAAPVAAGMRKRHVSIGASMAFWLGNPVLNPATLIFMTFVLSWKFTLLRIAFGLLLTFGIGYLASRVARRSEADVPEDVITDDIQEEGPLLTRFLKTVGRMSLHIIPAYLIGVVLLGAFQSFMFPVWVDGGILAILLFAVVGSLFVIPTAAEIPIIQMFMTLGVGAGPAGALLMTLPAISLPSMMIVARAFPRKVLLFAFFGVVVVGVLTGLTAMWWLA